MTIDDYRGHLQTLPVRDAVPVLRGDALLWAEKMSLFGERWTIQ
jgi:hypothetical protein